MNMQELKELIYQGEKVDMECKKAEKSVPKSAYESYSAFANTKGGYIILGVREDKTKTDPKERFIIQGIEDAPKQKEDFWNTINGNKVNINLLTDDDVKIVEDGSITLTYFLITQPIYLLRIFLYQIFSIIKQIIRILHYIIKQSLLFIFRNKNTAIANSSLAILQFIQ